MVKGNARKEDVAQSAKVLADIYALANELSEEEQLYILDVIKTYKNILSDKNTIFPLYIFIHKNPFLPRWSEWIFIYTSYSFSVTLNRFNIYGKRIFLFQL